MAATPTPPELSPLPTPLFGPVEPLVSLLMVARNAAEHIDAALTSARRQTLEAIEIVVVDDRSTDATGEIIRRHAEEDPRVIPVRGHGKGLAAVRNLSVAAAAAPYAAVLDADDILHPRHAEHLLDLARRTGADIAAANMIAFSREAPASLFASGLKWSAERMIGHADFVASGRLGREAVQLGYLKPLFRLDALRRHGLHYDLRLRIGEDWDLVERALAAGLTYAWRPEPTYYYRRHAASTSFRWTPEDLTALIAAERDRIAEDAGRDPALARARAERLASLEDTLAHCEAVAHLKSRAAGKAIAALARRPRAAGLLWQSVREGLARRAAAARRPSDTAPSSAGEGPHVLVCGEERPGSEVALAAALVKASGVPLKRLTRAQLADPLATARAGQGAAMVLLAEEALADAAAHAIGDGVPFVAAAGTAHPLVQHTIAAETCGELLGLIPGQALADHGLAWRERARPPRRGIAA
ncbi:glycosyltransferase family 2 protein [Erythrobacter sp. NE805]|uniref:glycosyltransferase family 2 protein n=1 Tax=Erythrobacter sp. NE805 TaxID=3389875 RepID=UPI00396AF035